MGIGLSACHRNENFIKIKGSDSVLPISQKEAEIYMQTSPKAAITVTGGGSGVGIASLIDGTTHIAMSSREIKVAEKLRLKDLNKTLRERIVAYDALAIVVHPGNPVSKITREQIEKIYTGKVKNWKELGGADQEIVAYARETSSGTYEYFKEALLGNREYDASVLSMTSNGAIIQSARQTPGAIGYIGLAYINNTVKSLEVSFDQGKNYIAPTFENAKKKIYPVSRPLYYYYTDIYEGRAAPFLNFVFSEKGQNIIKEIGYVPVK
ncbi:MAG: phosphate ABC transporter substrate-binding protein [Microscillaceae bacterium]|nr:phosphate ABC transporter substrate-binding protein [Microscillaceae bacterium]